MAVLRVPWNIRQALVCSVQQAPGGWQVSLWKAGWPDLLEPDADDGLLEMPWTSIQAGVPGMVVPVRSSGLRWYPTGTGWTGWTADGSACLMVPHQRLTHYYRACRSRSDAVLLISRLVKTWWPVLCFRIGGWHLFQADGYRPVQQAIHQQALNQHLNRFACSVHPAQHQAVQNGHHRPPEPADGHSRPDGGLEHHPVPNGSVPDGLDTEQSLDGLDTGSDACPVPDGQQDEPVLVGGLPGNGQDGFGNRCSVLVGQAGHQPETEQGGPVYQDDADYQDGYRAGRAGLNYQPDISTAWWSGWNDGHLMAGLKCPADNPDLSGTAVSNGLLETDIGKETDNQVLSITRQDRKETKK